MLVLISFGLVLVATVLLVVGLLSGGGLGLIYASIACSLAAGIALVVATVIRRPRAEGEAAPAGAWARDQEAASVGYAPTMASQEAALSESTAPVPAVPAAASYTPARRPAMATVGASAAGGDADEEFFPIEDYDKLKVAEILPLVPELYPDELDMVEARERETKGRVSVLNRIAEVRRRHVAETSGEGEPVGPAASEADDDEDFFPIEDYDALTVGEILPLLPELYEDELDIVERRERAGRGRVAIINRLAELRDGEPDEMVEPEEGAEPDVAPVLIDEGVLVDEEALGEDEDFFPIEDYDDLTVGEILPLLPELYEDELDVVEDRERATKGRAVILNRLAELRDAAEPDEMVEPEEGAEPDVAPVLIDEEVLVDEEALGEDEDFFPIEDYDELTVGEILPLLPELYEDELDVVEDRERATKGRAVILNRLAELRDAAEPDDTVEPEEVTDVVPVLVDEEALGEDEDFFPIEDYDDLTAGEILPLLPELYDDELDVVEDRERATKGRAVILDRLAELRDAGEPQAETAMIEEEEEIEEGEWEVPGEGWEDRGPVVAEAEPEEDVFPIADYDRLRVSEIRSVLPELSEDELEEVRSAERRGANRITVLTAIDRELGVEAVALAKKAPAKKAPAKKAPAKKAPAKKAPARKAPARKAPAKKAPAKKAPARKAPAKKAPAKKVGPTRKAATKKAGAAKKVGAKKLATRKVAARKVGAKKVGAKKAGARRV